MYIITLIIFAGILITAGACTRYAYKHLYASTENTVKPKPLKKELKECSNKKGDKYWIMYVNGVTTWVKWRKYKDAEFFYNHYKGIKRCKTCLDHVYYKVILDHSCMIYVVPEHEAGPIYYDEIMPTSLMGKYFIFMDDWQDENYYRSLEGLYNNILATDYWEEKTVLTNEEELQIEDKVSAAIDTNEIKELKRVINEYKEISEMNRIVFNKLTDNN